MRVRYQPVSRRASMSAEPGRDPQGEEARMAEASVRATPARSRAGAAGAATGKGRAMRAAAIRSHAGIVGQAKNASSTTAGCQDQSTHPAGWNWEVHGSSGQVATRCLVRRSDATGDLEKSRYLRLDSSVARRGDVATGITCTVTGRQRGHVSGETVLARDLEGHQADLPGPGSGRARALDASDLQHVHVRGAEFHGPADGMLLTIPPSKKCSPSISYGGSSRAPGARTASTSGPLGEPVLAGAFDACGDALERHLRGPR